VSAGNPLRRDGGSALLLDSARFEAAELVGSVTRPVKKFIANAFVVRDRNPDKDVTHLRTARTRRRYDPANSWVQFLWLSVRDAAVEGMKG
jgi:hypothetical protein